MDILIFNDGYVMCKSDFYSAKDTLSPFEYHFTSGVNKLVGEIDSGVWGVSYLLSMYRHNREDFVLFKDCTVIVDDTTLALDEFSEYSCYMDAIYPLFNTKIPVNKLVEKAINSNKLECDAESIRELFCIDRERFMRPLSQLGNEKFKAMAAIGYANKKQVFCFPWLSHKRYTYYHENLQELIKILADLNKVVVLPVGKK